MKLMSIINKIAAWVLAGCFLIFVVTGFDSQLRFLSPQITSLIHLKYLFPLAETAFAVHTSYAMYAAMKRKKFWNAWGKSLLGLYIAINLALVGVYAVIHL